MLTHARRRYLRSSELSPCLAVAAVSPALVAKLVAKLVRHCDKVACSRSMRGVRFGRLRRVRIGMGGFHLWRVDLLAAYHRLEKLQRVVGHAHAQAAGGFPAVAQM